MIGCVRPNLIYDWAHVTHEGDLIREARRRHRVDQRALARRAGTSQTHVSKIERGEVSPSVATLQRLLEVLGERLELRVGPGPRGNQADSELRRDFRDLAVAERIEQAVELSKFATELAASRRLR